jgi:hypothetical protein
MLQLPASGQISDGFSGPSEPVTLILYGPVQRAIELSADQNRAAQRISEEFRTSLKNLYARQLPSDQVRELHAREVERANAEVLGPLTPVQRERLKEIALQIREDVVKYSLTDVTLFDEELQNNLKLSDEQRSKIDQNNTEIEQSRQKLRQEMKRLRFRGKKEQQEYVFKHVGQAAFQRMFDVLTPDQQAAYQRFKGQKIDYALDDLPL